MQFTEGDKVLFVGEGDFSFVASLIHEKWCSKVKIIATCLQEELTERSKKTCEKLIERGLYF